MAAKADKKNLFVPKLKLALVEAWQWLNAHSQVDMRVFLPVFGGGVALLVAAWLLIPGWRPPASPPDTSLHTQIKHDDSAGNGTVTENAPVQPRTASEREKQAIVTNDSLGHQPLLAAPVQELTEGPAQTRIPKIADDGRRPWFVYSRPYDRLDPRPRIAVVFADMGIDRVLSESAIESLPGPVSLIFNSDGSAAAWMERARHSGHEVLLSAPMEPLDYPANDPGPGTLLGSLHADDNRARLKQAMSMGAGYIGLTTLTGSHFTSDGEALKPVLQDLQSRGLIWFDARLVPLASSYAVAEELKMPVVRTDFRITTDKSADSMMQILADAETNARHAGTATILVYPSPLSVQTLIDWSKSLPEKGFTLAPVTAMVD